MSILKVDTITDQSGKGKPNFPHGANVTGAVTGASGGDVNTVGNLTVSGNVGVGGTLTYEDVTDIDSIGIVTARSGLKIGPHAGVAGTFFADGSYNTSGIITATNVSVGNSVTAGFFYGNAATMTGAGPKGPLQQHMGMNDGSTRTLSMGTFTFPNTTAILDIATASYTDLPFTIVTYKPPSNAIGVLYEVTFMRGWHNDHDMNHHRLYVDSTEIVYARNTLCGRYREGLHTLKWYFRIGGSDNANTGQFASWNSNKVIKWRARNYGTGYRFQYHYNHYWDGGNGPEFFKPMIKITAFKSH
tara:strand:+ start:561 stop:1463 length:903 start_codon:yes stop_codon:yes gene_type:complete